MRGAFRSDENYFEFRERGSFRCQHPNEMLQCMLVVGPLFLVLTMASMWLASFNIFGLTFLSFVLFEIATVLICMGVFNVITSGVEYKYDAKAEEFLITDDKGGQTVIVYADVTGVRYKPKKLFTRQRGYTVTIETRYRDFVYEYIYSKNKLYKDPSGSPFHIIEERAELMRGREKKDG